MVLRSRLNLTKYRDTIKWRAPSIVETKSTQFRSPFYPQTHDLISLGLSVDVHKKQHTYNSDPTPLYNISEAVWVWST